MHSFDLVRSKKRCPHNKILYRMGGHRYASMTAAGAGSRSAWGRAYAPRSASARNAGIADMGMTVEEAGLGGSIGARARNAGDREYGRERRIK